MLNITTKSHTYKVKRSVVRAANLYIVEAVNEKEENVMIKIIAKVLKNSQEAFHIQHEFTVHKSVNHENIIKYIEDFEDLNYYYLITEHFQGQTLEQWYRSSYTVNEKRIKNIFRQILLCLSYLHSNNISHCNITPTAIYIDSQDKVKVTDFSCAEDGIYYGNLLMQRKENTNIIYTPPEILRGKTYKGELKDSWSAGVILYILFNNGVPPYKGTTVNELVAEMDVGSPPQPSKMPTAAFRIATQLADVDQLRRYSCAQALAHFWMANKEKPFFPMGSKSKCMSAGPNSLPLVQKVMPQSSDPDWARYRRMPQRRWSESRDTFVLDDDDDDNNSSILDPSVQD